MPLSEDCLSHETDELDDDNGSETMIENTLLRVCRAEFVVFWIQNKPVSTEKRETFTSLLKQFCLISSTFPEKFSDKLWFNPLLTNIACIIQVTKNKK